MARSSRVVANAGTLFLRAAGKSEGSRVVTVAPDALFYGSPPAGPKPAVAILCSSPFETEILGHDLGSRACAGTVVLLKGSLGAGKSVFARGFVRGAVGDPARDVPSPTFLLDNVYETPHSHTPVHHMDLYRVHHPDDLAALDLPTAFGQICVVEHAQRLGEALPAEFLLVGILTDSERLFPAALRKSPRSGGRDSSPSSGAGNGTSSSPRQRPFLSSPLAGPLQPALHAPYESIDLDEDTSERAVILYPKGQKYEQMVSALQRVVDFPRVELR